MLFAVVLTRPIFIYIQRVISEVSWPVATKLCHLVGSECNLSTGSEIWAQKHKSAGSDFGQLQDLTTTTVSSIGKVVRSRSRSQRGQIFEWVIAAGEGIYACASKFRIVSNTSFDMIQESGAVARKPRDAAAVPFGLKFADNITTRVE